MSPYKPKESKQMLTASPFLPVLCLPTVGKSGVGPSNPGAENSAHPTLPSNTGLDSLCLSWGLIGQKSTLVVATMASTSGSVVGPQIEWERVDASGSHNLQQISQQVHGPCPTSSDT